MTFKTGSKQIHNHLSLFLSNYRRSLKQTIVGLRINETLQTGAVRKPHLPGGESAYLFLEFTINQLWRRY